MKTLLLLFFVLVLSHSVWSQDILTATIKWNTTSTFDANSGTWTEEVTSLTTSENTIAWNNADGSVRRSFHIIERIGEWTNVATDGKMRYEVTDHTGSGSISIRRSGAEIKILIVLAAAEPSTKELIVNGHDVL